MKRLPQAIALVVAALLLASCATATLTRLAYANAALAYSNLGPMLTWMIDDYVDLTDAQEDWVRGRVARTMQWHRTLELPKYRRFLEAVLAKTEGPFTAQDVGVHQKALRAHYQRFAEQVIPDIAEFLGNMDTEQVGQLERKFVEENAKFTRESIRGSADERRSKRLRRFIDHLEGWVGSLSTEQRERVADFYRTAPDISEEILGERRVRQGEILALVRAKAPREQMSTELKRLLVDIESWRRPEYIQKLRARDQKMSEMLAALSATLSAEQRAELQKRIRGLMRDIATLTAARGTGAGGYASPGNADGRR